MSYEDRSPSDALVTHDISSDALATRVFLITAAAAIAFVVAVFIFVL